VSKLAQIGLYAGSAVFVLNWLTTFFAALKYRRTEKHCSPVWIPIVGPLFISGFLLSRGYSWWVSPLPWILDIATMGVIVSIPRIVRDEWRTSGLTRIATLVGDYDIQTARLSLHRRGHYLLKKKWHRAKPEPGIISLGELGSYCCDGPDILLESQSGASRRLSLQSAGRYAVLEGSEFSENDSLQGWVLRIVDGDLSQCS